jgi:hypothetical protein
MGNVISYQVGGVQNNDTPDPQFNYNLSVNQMTSHSIVDGNETTSSGGVTSVKVESSDAGINIGGVNVSPYEAEQFQKQLEKGDQDESHTDEQDGTSPSETFDNNTNTVLDDLDAGDLANAINIATIGEGLNDDAVADMVSSLGFSDRESALEVGTNLIDSAREPFNRIARSEGFEGEGAWNALRAWNKTELRNAVNDWITSRGQDTQRLREAMRNAWNAYGRADNVDLIEELEEQGYRVQSTSSGGIVVKGNELDDWTVWRDVRSIFQKRAHQ